MAGTDDQNDHNRTFLALSPEEIQMWMKAVNEEELYHFLRWILSELLQLLISANGWSTVISEDKSLYQTRLRFPEYITIEDITVGEFQARLEQRTAKAIDLVQLMRLRVYHEDPPR